jgi:cytochrome c553
MTSFSSFWLISQRVGRRTAFALIICGPLLGHPVRATDAAITPPPWAYPISAPLAPIGQISDAQVRQSLSGTQVQYTKAQLRNLFAAPDWRPETHPTMPEIVATGRKPAVFACAYCHQPNGVGRPENANLTGLSAAYMQRQLADYRAGLRKSSVAEMLPQALMLKVASQATQEELDAAITYFGSLPVHSTVSVVEADSVPRSQPAGWALVPLVQGGSEPLGTRIVELPDNPASIELRDSTATFTAYVPRGALEQGRKLATSSDSAHACTACHGAQLRGLGEAPSIAGRSPSYLMRQLVDFKSGARTGQMGAQMRGVATAMSEGDMIAAAAYAASLKP